MSMIGGSLYYASALRAEISQRNREYAAHSGAPMRLSRGGSPAVCYIPYDNGRDRGQNHGNFFPASYRAILKDPAWARRLRKVHSQARTSLPANEHGDWNELDSCHSSDALLMNIFCCPRVLAQSRVRNLLGVEAGTRPGFGFRPRVPLQNGHCDRTEVDMRLGNLLVEAKLTESDFQKKSVAAMAAYREFPRVFCRSMLPRANGEYLSYQLLRNVLAAQAMACAFCVLLDSRRPDLLEAWYAVLRSVQPCELRLRCKALTWQELAAVLPRPLQAFLETKYGILRH